MTHRLASVVRRCATQPAPTPSRRGRAALAGVLALSLTTTTLIAPAHAALITTPTLLDAPAMPTLQHVEDARQRVGDRLVAMGADPATVRDRLAALTDEEARQLAAEMDRLPAGGDIFGALVFIFLVLLITDILGYTDVYPFVTRTVNGDKPALTP